MSLCVSDFLHDLVSIYLKNVEYGALRKTRGFLNYLIIPTASLCSVYHTLPCRKKNRCTPIERRDLNPVLQGYIQTLVLTIKPLGITMKDVC